MSPLGGLARRASYIKSVRDAGEPVWLLDGGGAFGNPDAASPLEDRLRAEYLLEGMDLCGYDAMTLGEEELRFGESFLAERLAEAELEATSANVVRQDDGLPYGTRVFTKTVGEITVGAIGVLSEQAREQVEVDSATDGAALTVEQVAGSIAAARAEMGEVDVLVVLAHMPLAPARELAGQATEADVVVASHDRVAPTSERVGDVLLATTGYDGKWIGRVGLVLDADGDLSDVTWAAVALDDSWEDDPELAALYEEYLERLETEADAPAEDTPRRAP